jgi:hypothetical protein
LRGFVLLGRDCSPACKIVGDRDHDTSYFPAQNAAL